MERYSRKVKDGFWYISVAAERRTAVIESLRRCPGVVTANAYCPIGETDSEKIKVLVSERIDEEAQNEILAICDGATEPEKPRHHPILDDVWTLDSLGRIVTSRDQYAENIYGQDVLISVPDLLRAIEKHHLGITPIGRFHEEIDAVLNKMGILPE